MEIRDFERGPRTLRAALCRGTPRYGTDEYDDGEAVDRWVWFVAHPQDLWFAHGISDHMTTKAVDDMAGAIDGEVMDVMISSGEPWNVVAAEPARVGSNACA